MTSTPKQGSMRQVINNIYKILIEDRYLLSLLLYLPEDLPEILEDLPDFTERDDYWDIVDERIVLGEKVSDLENKELCRIYISPERRRSIFNNYLQATQGVVVSVFVHENYSKDMRIEWISDRLNELLALERIEGSYGKLEYLKGDPWVAPRQYQQYRHVYQFVTGKK